MINTARLPVCKVGTFGIRVTQDPTHLQANKGLGQGWASGAGSFLKKAVTDENAVPDGC